MLLQPEIKLLLTMHFEWQFLRYYLYFTFGISKLNFNSPRENGEDVTYHLLTSIFCKKATNLLNMQTMPEVFILGFVNALSLYRDLVRTKSKKYPYILGMAVVKLRMNTKGSS